MSRRYWYAYVIAVLGVFLGGAVCGGTEGDGDGGPGTPTVDPELCTRTERDAATNEIRELQMSGRDEYGRLVLQEVDTGGDGTIDWKTEYGYDGQSRLSSKRVDLEGDGQWNRVYTFTYDGRGRKATESVSFPQDGGSRRSSFHYDDQDRVSYIDDDYGTYEGRRTFTYSDRVTRLENDERLDGVLDSIDEYHFDEAWHLVTELQDWDGNRAWDVRWTYGYDGAGNQTSRQLDEGDDGSVDKRWTTTFDANGAPVSGTVDEDGDGNVDVRVTFSQACQEWER